MAHRTWFPRRWLLLLALGITFVWWLWRRREAGRSDLVRPAAPAPAPAPAPPSSPPSVAGSATPSDQTPARQESQKPDLEEAAPAAMDRPEALAAAEAARILGCPPEEVSQLLNGGPNTRESVEQLALEHYRWRKHVHDPDSYWVTLKQASTILGISSQRLKQLLDSGDVPYSVHREGVRLMRREQLDESARTAEEKM